MHLYRVNIAFEGLRVGTTFMADPSPRLDALTASGYISSNGSVEEIVEAEGREGLVEVIAENAKRRPRRTAEKE